ncbi:sensor histidine kinase [Agromyces atrinae]|nr:histidine kinase [Agromyces atrinae]NYD67428.1 signal transduction histidine kinase [Agromyces atrinae]
MSALLDTRDTGATPTPPRPPGAAHPPRRVGQRVWGEVWRLLASLLLGALLLVVSFGLSIDAGADDSDLRLGGTLVADVAMGLVALALLPFRRLAPLPIAVILGLAGGFSAFAAPAAFLVLVSISTRRRWFEIGMTVAAWLTSLTLVEIFGLHFMLSPSSPGDALLALLVGAVLVFAGVAIGVSIGNRRELVASLRERANLVVEEQNLRIAHAREHERTLIAREMHDVLGHRLSLIAMHSGVLRYRTDLDAADRADTVAIVHDTTRLALGDLREVLGVLRSPGDSFDPPANAPQPSLDDVASLVHAEPLATLTITAETLEIPATVGRHAYRIVQECLTNARKHAPGQPVTVDIIGTAGESLTIVVRNTLAPGGSTVDESGGGFGLVGIDERARSLGGTASVETHAGAHTVTVTLPWPTS